MNLATLLPSHPIAIHCAEPVEACVARLARVLAPPDQFSLIGRRVRGTATADGVHLWYSLRPRPGRLSPQLVARWSTENGTTRLVGEIRQDPLIALRVAMTGALLAIVLVAMAFRGAASIATALLGGVVLGGYPWIAWYMSSGDIGKIEAFLRQELASAPASRG